MNGLRLSASKWKSNCVNKGGEKNVNTYEPFDTDFDTGPIYTDMTAHSVYIPMRDGVRLAADVYLPKDLSAGERIPALLYQTRYWRSMELRPPFSWLMPGPGDHIPLTRKAKAFYVLRGYALVNVDVRGTGASFGVSRYPWEEVTVKDAAEVLDWITAQSWSDGGVAGMGVSFLGTTAELLLATCHPALKAVIPQFNHPDPFTDIAMPGGLANERFVRAWSELNYALDHNIVPKQYGQMMKLLAQGVQPVGGEAGRKDLLAAVQMRAENGSPDDLKTGITFRDEAHPEKGYTLDDQAVIRFREALTQSQVPVFGWASWLDAGTANAALRRFLTFSNPQRVVIGAWNHGGIKKSSPYQVSDDADSHSAAFQRREILRFLNAYLKSPENKAPLENKIYYYTLGAEKWQASSTWPPPGTRRERWYFGPGFKLLPQQSQEEGTDLYSVDFNASTGIYNRWWELGVVQGKTVDYGNRAGQRPYVLGYESLPLERDIEISGFPIICLYVASTETDSAFHVYLEDVFPDGRIVHITEGQLRAIHRKVTPPSDSPYRLHVPYHTFKKVDAEPMVPGEMTKITFGLLPISVLVRQGHRIRVAVAGHDQGTFPRVPTQETPVWTVARTHLYPSSIELPIRG
jgi:uncharacterized protein